MNQSARHLGLGLTTGVTVFAAVVALIHLMVELVAAAGFEFGSWNNPVQVFIFLVSALLVGVVPWGLWILLTDAREGHMFNTGHDVAWYLMAALGVYVTSTLLVCTILQSFYAQFRWFLTPGLLVCAVALIRWRWNKVWGFPVKIGFRSVLDYALALPRDSQRATEKSDPAVVA